MDTLTLDGFVHVVGRVGAGKSTLYRLIATLAAEQGKRMLIILSDVGAVFNEVRWLERVGIRAVPLLGRTTRRMHLERLINLQGGAISATADPSFRYVVPECPLLAEQEHRVPLGKEPCYELRPFQAEASEKPASRQTYACPLEPVCPRFEQDRALAQAPIWVTTPEGLLSRRLRTSAGDMLFSEAVSRCCDLVVADEVDMLQTRLEDAFASMTVIGGEGNSSLDRLISHTRATESAVAHGVDRLPQFRAWTSWLVSRADAARRGVFGCLLARFGAVHRMDFTSYDLILGVAASCAGIEVGADIEDPELAAVYASVRDTLLAYRDRPYREAQDDGDPEAAPARTEPQNVDTLVEIAEAFESAEDERAAETALAEWVQRHRRAGNRSSLGKTVDRLRLALATARLEHAFREVMFRLPGMEDTLGVVSPEWELFPNPQVRGYEGVLPEPPMGTLFHFTFHRRADQGGTLECTCVQANGRVVLPWLPRLFLSLDGVPGPHVLAMSGTSWAPGAARHHVAAPALLVRSRSMPPTVTAAVWQPSDGIRLKVSGVGDRDQALGAVRDMAYRLAIARPGDRSTLERERDVLATKDPDRGRVVLLTSSYAQSHTAYEGIRNAIGGARADQEVRVLCADDGDTSGFGNSALRRSWIEGFGEDPEAWLLVANIYSFSRGHNILTRLDGGGAKAAIGSAYFLVRPMPVVDDLGYVISRLNGWALEYFSQHRDLADIRSNFRKGARGQFRRLLREPPFLVAKDPEERQRLFWHEVVLHVQAVGRLTRGDVPARLWFCDAAYLPREYSRQADRDSVLLGMRQVLHDALGSDAPYSAVVRDLYEPFYRALCELGEL